MTPTQHQDMAKRAAGRAAADLIPSGTLVGLGTGSTVYYFIERLAERLREGLKIQAVSSSTRSEELARQVNIPVLPMDQITQIDITVDGADEIDPQKRMIKGGGSRVAAGKNHRRLE